MARSLKAGDRNSNFVRACTDQEIGEFVKMMRSGTEDEKTKAVETASEKIGKSEGFR